MIAVRDIHNSGVSTYSAKISSHVIALQNPFYTPNPAQKEFSCFIT
jgi:hypothetical protein